MQDNFLQSAPLFIFDIETVPDLVLAKENYRPNLDCGQSEEDLWCDLRIADAIRQQRNVNFLPSIFHTVISIFGVWIDPATHFLKDTFKKTIPTPQSRAELHSSEKQLLREFWENIARYNGNTPLTVCGYNITGFDLPVLEQRSIKYLLSGPGVNKSLNANDMHSSANKVFDICSYFSHNQQQCRTSLNNLAHSLGLAGKMEGMHGSKVAEAYFKYRQWEKIEKYCEVDVLITYGVFLAVQKFRNIISESQYKHCLRHFHEFLMQEGKPDTYRELANGSKEFFKDME